MKKIIFIIGVGRSGTSLLQSMLHAHSQICFIPEAQFIKHYMRRANVQRNYEQAGIKKFKKIVEEDEYIQKSGVDYETWLLPFISSKNDFKLNKVFSTYLEQYCTSNQVTYYGEKDARNIDFLKQLKANFSDAKIILIVRDPREVVLSKTKASWSAGRPYWLHALIGNAQLQLGYKDGKKYFKDSFIQIRYEDLTLNPEQILGEICEFLSIPFEENMLSFHKNAGELFRKNREMQYKYNNFKPLLKNNSTKWKKELPQSKISFIEVVSQPTMRKFNYQIESQTGFIHKVMGWFFSVNFLFLYWIVRKFR